MKFLMLPIVLFGLLIGVPDHAAAQTERNIGTQWINKHQVVSFQAGAYYFSDPLGDRPVYTAASDNGSVVKATVIPDTDTVVFTGVALGTAQVTITATDSDGGSDSISFKVNVFDFYFSVDTTAVSEDAGIRTLTATVALLGAAPETDLEIETRIWHTSASPVDYWLTGWDNFDIPAGKFNKTVKIRFRPIPDPFFEEDEVMELHVSGHLRSQIGNISHGNSLSGFEEITILDSLPPMSGVVTGTTLRAPRNVRWDATPNSVTVRWDPPLVGKPTGYFVTSEAIDDQGEILDHRDPAPDTRLDADAISFKHDGLHPGQAYHYRIQSEGNDNNIPAVIVFRTPLEDAEGPGPRNLRVSPDGRVVWEYDGFWRPDHVVLFRWTWDNTPPTELPPLDSRRYGSDWASENNCDTHGSCELWLDRWDSESHYLIQMLVLHGFTEERWRTIRHTPETVQD